MGPVKLHTLLTNLSKETETIHPKNTWEENDNPELCQTLHCNNKDC